MKLWRISNYMDLRGVGGLKYAGRWHNRGVSVVYLAESAALAMLEVLVHFSADLDEIPEQFQLLEVDYSKGRSTSRLQMKVLPDDWTETQDVTRAMGDEWLLSASSALLRVPSAVAPSSFNYLLNPRHPDAHAASVVSVTRHPFDQRLFGADLS